MNGDFFVENVLVPEDITQGRWFLLTVVSNDSRLFYIDLNIMRKLFPEFSDFYIDVSIHCYDWFKIRSQGGWLCLNYNESLQTYINYCNNIRKMRYSEPEQNNEQRL